MNSPKLTLLLIFLILALTGKSFGQWTKMNGPYAGTRASCFTSYENTIYAGTESHGIFLSTDRGASWNSINTDLPFPGVLSLLGADTTLFAGTYDGLYYSADNGLNWNAVKEGIPVNRRIYSLVKFDSLIFVGTDYAGIYRSADNGTTWTQTHSGYQNSIARGIVSYGGKFFAGIENEGLVVSTDDGVSWVPSTLEITTGTFTTLIIHNNMIFCGNLYFSADSGKSWKRESEGMSYSINGLASIDSFIFAGTCDGGVLRSADYGKTWTPVNTGFLPNPCVYTLYVIGSNLFASTYDGLFLSTDLGASWNMLDFRFSDTYVNCLVADKNNIYAGTLEGVFRSGDAGSSWTALNNGLTSYEVTSFLIKGTNLYAGTRGGMFRSTDQGASWSRLDLGSSGDNIISLAANDTSVFAANNINTVFMSSDNGVNWKSLPPLPDIVPPIPRIGIRQIVVDGLSLFAGTGLGVYHLAIDNPTWTEVDSGLLDLSVRSLMFADKNLYAGTGHGLFLSTDYGKSWAIFYNGISNTAIGTLASGNGAILAATGPGLAVSWDNGTNWKVWVPHQEDFPSDTYVSSILYQDTVIYMGTFGYGVWSYKLSSGTTKINGDSYIGISRFYLEQNYPNPFNPKTNIEFTLPKSEWVSLKVFNILGQKVVTLLSERLNPGIHKYQWQADHLPSGIYYCRLQAGEDIQVRKMVLLR